MYKNTINLTDGCFPTIVVCPVERCPVRPGLVLAAAWRPCSHCHDTRHGMDTADTAASYPSLDTEVSPARVSRVVLQKVPSEANPKVRNHGEGPY